MTPKTSPDDGDRDHTQLYGQSRTSALQAAVNNFIDQAAAANGEIQNQNNKHRISIVVFSGNASTEDGLTVCEGNGATQLKNTVNDLGGSGATNAGAGMQHAERVLENSQRDAAQVVIFFTDGVPTTSSSFSATVANTAVTSAHNMKNDGAAIYSIGIFEGADPDVTSGSGETANANQFMNAVSSNYPNATAYNQLGQRGEGDYYKATSDANELNTIFEDIFKEEQEDNTSGSPLRRTLSRATPSPVSSPSRISSATTCR